MKRAFSQPLLKHCEESDYEEEEECKVQNQVSEDDDDMADQVSCISLHRREPTKRVNMVMLGEEQSWDNSGLWRQEQKRRAVRLEKQLKSRWALEDLVEEQLNCFQAHYNRATGPTRLKDVAQLLMPKGAPAHEMASVAWLGDWRPSAILDLLRSMAQFSSSLQSSLWSLSDSFGIEQTLAQLIHEIGIEEAVLDEEMAEIQANCILHLPFGPVSNRAGCGPALACVQSEFKKIHRVIIKAQNLRFKALELVVKKVLNQTDAAEFFVAFVGIQDLIHQFATQQKLQKGPVSVPVKAFRVL